MAAAASAAPAGRQFTFFQLVQVKDAHDAASGPDIFRSVGEISAMTPSSFGVLVADIHGSIHILNGAFESTQNWRAHVNGRVTHMMEHKAILVTLGEVEASRLPLLQIWDLEHKDKKTGAPLLLRSAKVQHGNKPHPISTIALSSSLSHLAIGLGDGTVLLYRHLDQYLFSGSNALSALPKAKVVHESPTEPVTGLGFREPLLSSSDKAEREHLYLFITTTNRVLSYLAAGKGSGIPPVVVNEVGCGLGCATMDHRTREMAIARDEAIYMCKPDGLGACYAIEWPKISITSFRNYLAIVSPPFFPSSASTSATVRNYVARASNPTTATQTDVSKVTIFDLENKFIAYSESTFSEGVRSVVCDQEHIYILGNDGKFFRMEEKSTSQKLSILFSKSQYVLALSLARSDGLEDSNIATIHRQYGDHLYLKGDFDGAIQQYVNTLGHLQPSYVIRKFLDAQRIHNLATYLQELHARGLANSDHTTLLLNTYTKLRDVSRLDTFIKAESVRFRGSDGTKGRHSKDELPFDLETAIRVCRQAGYFEHAVYLAKKYERHEDYLRIQIEDTGNIKDALAYLRELGLDAAAINLVKYGRIMLSKLPQETTQLLVEVCSGTSPNLSSPANPSEAINGTNGAVAHSRGPSSALPYLSYLTYNRSSTTESPNPNSDQISPSLTLPNAVESAPNESLPPLTPTVTEQLAHSESTIPSSPTVPSKPSPVNRPAPSQYFAHFVHHPQFFIQFLEAVAFNRWRQRVDLDSLITTTTTAQVSSPLSGADDKSDQIAVWNTLLELYLISSQEADADKDTSAILRRKAIHVLQSERVLPYDTTHALIVCSTHSFTEGLVLLWEKMDMYEDVLRFWMDRSERAYREDPGESDSSPEEASARVIAYLNLYGPAHPHLYPLVLRFLTSSPALLSRHTADLASVLDHINREKIIPPVGVIQILSRNEVASVSLVKDWLMTRIAESRDEVDADRQLIESYRGETRVKLKEIADLSDPEHPRVFHVTRCSSCHGQLDLPTVHFMCNHSYHQRCLAEHETECPNCARDHGLIREIRRENKQFAAQHDLFLYNVEREGFSAIASAFSKGIIGVGVADG